MPPPFFYGYFQDYSSPNNEEACRTMYRLWQASFKLLFLLRLFGLLLLFVFL
jgi:maltodextrin utilization protein YvdJ